MRTWLRMIRWTALALLACGLAPAVLAQRVQLISALESGQNSPAGGSGDSSAPILSQDGRYVLFASTANNLLLLSNNAVMPPGISPVLNAFLRDRTNGVTTLVSINLSGTGGGNEDSVPVDISTNGRYAMFESSASNLVPGDTNIATDIFVRDLIIDSTVLVSVSTNGVPGNGASRSPAMTPDGRYVAFVSAASDLVSDDTNGIPDVFVRDLLTGVTRLASVGARSTSPSSPSGSSEAPDITPDGHYVVFQSTATNLVSGTHGGRDVYVRDLAGNTTTWVSVDARARLFAAFHTSNAICCNHAISTNGQFVAYEASTNSSSLNSGLILRYNLGTGLTDLVDTNATVATTPYEDFHSLAMTPDGRLIAYIANTNSASGSATCVRLWDGDTGTSTLISGDSSNNVPTNSTCAAPAIDSTGRLVAFLSSAPNLTTNMQVSDYHLYLRDTLSGNLTLLDADTNGVGSPVGPAAIPCLSADGWFVAFDCPDANLVPDDRNRDSDVFTRDLGAGTCEMVSLHDAALPAVTLNGTSIIAPTSVSYDGNYLAFVSEADNLVMGDTNRCRDVFVKNLVAGTTLRVSVATNGASGNSVSTDPAISGDGRYVAFTSSASNLVAGDTNNAQDLFVRDLQTGITTLISTNRTGTGPGNKDSYLPILSSNGQYVLFRSLATDLATGSFSGENLFCRDLLAATNYVLTRAGVVSVAMTPDGHFITFVDGPGTAAGKFYVWDSAAAALISTNLTLPGISSVVISPAGNCVAAWTSSGGWSLSVFDLEAGTNRVIASGVSPGSHPVMKFNATGHRLAYTGLLATTNQVFLYDSAAGSNLLVSQNYSLGTGAIGDSDSPDISTDGRFVVYRSTAPDIVSGDTNGLPDIFLYDSQTRSNSLLSVGQSSCLGANNRSLSPVFSGNGQTLFFQSWASDLTAQDFNHSSDVLSFTLFYAMILPSAVAGEGPVLSWPWIPGASYRVQYKEGLTDTVWNDLGGSVTHAGNKAYLQDVLPNASQRFYRIVSF